MLLDNIRQTTFETVLQYYKILANACMNIAANRKKRNLSFFILGIIILLFCWYFHSLTYETTDNAFIEGRIVPISTRVPGFVTKIYVRDNEMLFTGQLMLELDPKDFELKIERAKAIQNSIIAQHKAALKNFETAVVSVPSIFESAKAALESAQANYERANGDLTRLKGLNELTLTRRDLEHAISAEKLAKAQLRDAEAKLKSASSVHQTLAIAEAKVEELKAQMIDSQAALAQAEKDLADTKIHAPYPGRVTNRLIEVGTYVQPGQSLFSVIGRDLWVVANFKESQINRIKPGQKVRINIDAFPNLNYKGVVDSIQAGTGSKLSLFPPENASGNYVKIIQRVPVKIVFEQELDPLVPIAVGMSVAPKVYMER